jgi:hypothetical protein
MCLVTPELQRFTKPNNTFKGTIMTYILNKDQHIAFNASWKEAHAAKRRLSSGDFLTQTLISSPIDIGKRKAVRAFSPCKYKNPPYQAFGLAIDGLIYWAKKKQNTWLNDLQLSDVQWAQFIQALEELRAGLNGE